MSRRPCTSRRRSDRYSRSASASSRRCFTSVRERSVRLPTKSGDRTRSMRRLPPSMCSDWPSTSLEYYRWACPLGREAQVAVLAAELGTRGGGAVASAARAPPAQAARRAPDGLGGRAGLVPGRRPRGGSRELDRQKGERRRAGGEAV